MIYSPIQTTNQSVQNALNDRVEHQNPLENAPNIESPAIPPHQRRAGRGKRSWAPTSHTNAAIADVEEPSDVEEVIDAGDVLNQNRKMLDQGGVDVDTSDRELSEEMETALAISEDEPTLREALSGDEHEAWLDAIQAAIEAELTQMEKLNTWAPVVPPSDANIIPSLFVYR